MSLLQLFPAALRPMFAGVADREKRIREIRLRVGQPVTILEAEERYLARDGRYVNRPEQAYYIGAEELDGILQHICHDSIYAYEEEIRQGYLTVAGGHRVGLAGRAVLEGDGVRTIRHISGMNIRVAHQVIGAADGVMPFIYKNNRVRNTLIVSPPGCGKTTLLRDMIRQISGGNRYGAGQNVSVVDERSELAGCYLGVPQNDVGPRTDVLDGCPKAVGMMMLLRAMAPQVIAIDELGSEEELHCVHVAASSGVQVVATMHGESLEDIREGRGVKGVLEEKLFDMILLLGRVDGHCRPLRLYEKQGQEAWNCRGL